MNRFANVSKLVVATALVAGVSAVASPTLQSTSYDESSSRVNMDIGLTVGTPAGLNLVVTKWGIGPVPVLLRMSGGYFGNSFYGYQPEVGIAFDTEGSFRQYISVAYTKTDIDITRNGTQRGLAWEGFGPMYGINWGGFTAQVGVSFGKGFSVEDFAATKLSSPQLQAQIGYAYYF